MKEFLSQLPLFSGLPEADLERLVALAQPVQVEAGRVLMEEGSPGDTLYVVLDGTFEVTKRSGERDLIIGSCGKGEVLGEIALLEQAPRTATVHAVRDSRLLQIDRDTFEGLLRQSPTAAVAVLRTVTARLRNTETMLRQSEKMAALGTLSAGLAHELNNPAAAVRSSSSQLRLAVAEWQRSASELGMLGLAPGQAADLGRLQEDLARRASGRPAATLDPLARSDREDELQIWLEELGLDGAWEMAPALVALGWTAADLEALAATFSGPHRALAARWLAAGSSVHSLLAEVHQGADRIAEIVHAVKSYAYLDQAPVQLVDVHDGLENTLVILRHKLKQGVTVHREYEAGLPRIEAYASELNQVWTNLIDNAIDAMRGQGEVRIRTRIDGDAVVVEITDDGAGIPLEIQERVFDAFFTTKPVGVGTGLGLHIVYNIVVQQHRGQITVRSRPGETTFRVVLPVRLREPAEAQAR